MSNPVPPVRPLRTLAGAPIPPSLRAPSFTPRRREAYTIERYPTVDNGVLLIGYDGRGEVMVELRVSARRFNERMIDRMRRWMKANDDSGHAPTPPVSLLK